MRTTMPMPMTLLTGDYADGKGGYDAIGWMLRHLFRLESKYINSSRPHVRKYERELCTNLNISREELMALTERLDNAHPKIRVPIFRSWCKQHGLDFHD